MAALPLAPPSRLPSKMTVCVAAPLHLIYQAENLLGLQPQHERAVQPAQVHLRRQVGAPDINLPVGDRYANDDDGDYDDNDDDDGRNAGDGAREAGEEEGGGPGRAHTLAGGAPRQGRGE